MYDPWCLASNESNVRNKTPTAYEVSKRVPRALYSKALTTDRYGNLVQSTSDDVGELTFSIGVATVLQPVIPKRWMTLEIYVD